MNALEQRLAVYAGPIFLLLFTVGIVSAGFIPPSRPSLSPEQVVAIYDANRGWIRLGMALQISGAGFQIFFAAAITTQMRRIPNSTWVFPLTQFGAASANTILFILPPLVWAVAAFRPEHQPDLMVALHDLGWFLFVVPFSLAMVQCLSIAAAILVNPRSRLVFPRWYGYYNVWAAILFIPGICAIFFHTGPFAWNGLLTFWLGAINFGVWFQITIILLLRAIKAEERSAM